MRTTLARVWSPILLIAPLAYSLPLEAQVPELTYTVVKSWSTLYDTSITNPAYGPVNSPDGIAWDGSGLWISGSPASPAASLSAARERPARGRPARRPVRSATPATRAQTTRVRHQTPAPARPPKAPEGARSAPDARAPEASG
jgi:hypothetical protein